MSTITPTQALIDRLSTEHAWYFTGYILFLLLGGLFSWLLWRSGNRVQDAIRQDAIATIMGDRRLSTGMAVDSGPMIRDGNEIQHDTSRIISIRGFLLI